MARDALLGGGGRAAGAASPQHAQGPTAGDGQFSEQAGVRAGTPSARSAGRATQEGRGGAFAPYSPPEATPKMRNIGDCPEYPNIRISVVILGPKATGLVYDANVGPHTGEDTILDYFAKVIDSSSENEKFKGSAATGLRMNANSIDDVTDARTIKIK